MMNKFTEDSVLKWEPRTLSFRNEPFTVIYHFYQDRETGEAFTIPALDELNIAQVHNQYRFKNGIPFIDEIKNIRAQYGLSASKMSEVLGLGTNVYKSYENGEMPSPATGRLIQLIKDPEEFKKLLEYSRHKLDEHELDKIYRKVAAQLSSWDAVEKMFDQHLFGEINPNVFNGFKVPTLEKVGNVVRYFSCKLSPFTTKMNKLLFFSDFLHYKRTGYSICGLSYKAITLGPVPNNYSSLYDRLCEEGYVDKKLVTFDNRDNKIEGEQFVAKGDEVNQELFTPSELEAMDDVIAQLGKMTTNKIVEVSHEEDAWVHNVDEKKRVNYQYSFSLKTIK